MLVWYPPERGCREITHPNNTYVCNLTFDLNSSSPKYCSNCSRPSVATHEHTIRMPSKGEPKKVSKSRVAMIERAHQTSLYSSLFALSLPSTPSSPLTADRKPLLLSNSIATPIVGVPRLFFLVPVQSQTPSVGAYFPAEAWESKAGRMSYAYLFKYIIIGDTG